MKTITVLHWIVVIFLIVVVAFEVHWAAAALFGWIAWMLRKIAKHLIALTEAFNSLQK